MRRRRHYLHDASGLVLKEFFSVVDMKEGCRDKEAESQDFFVFKKLAGNIQLSVLFCQLSPRKVVGKEGPHRPQPRSSSLRKVITEAA